MLQATGKVDPWVEFTMQDPTREDEPDQRQLSTCIANEPSPRWGDKFDFIDVSPQSTLLVQVRPWLPRLAWMRQQLPCTRLTAVVWRAVRRVRRVLAGCRSMKRPDASSRSCACRSGTRRAAWRA